MKISNALLWLVPLVALLALVAAGVGLFWQDSGQPFPFTTIHGETIQMYGQGIYRNDTFFRAPIFRGTDALTLFFAIPLLVLATILYRRRSLRGGLLLSGLLSYFLYNAASLALGAAYNNLFLIYIAYFSSSLFAFILALTSFDLAALAGQVSPRLPHRGIAIFLFVAGSSVFVWLIEIVAGLLNGSAPANLASYTTDTTAVFDLGIIAPTAFLAGVLMLRRAPLAYLLAPVLIILNALVGMMVVMQSVVQAVAGISLTGGETFAYVIPFVGLSLIALWLIILIFRNVAEIDQTPDNIQPVKV